jgi:hypothetical protein
MWVRSQNKKVLLECTSFSVTKNFGGKKKGAIIGSTSNGFWGNKDIVLGLYDTEEIAVSELTRLQTELINEVKIYEMS